MTDSPREEPRPKCMECGQEIAEWEFELGLAREEEHMICTLGGYEEEYWDFHLYDCRPVE